MNILNFEKFLFNKSYITISLLGISFKLNIKYSNVKSVEVVKKENEINMFIPKQYKSCDNSKLIALSIQALYNQMGKEEIENALEFVRHLLKFAPKDYKIKNLNNVYYKCNRNKTLIISPDIIRYSRETIIETLIQAFCKIQYTENSIYFTSGLQDALEKYNNYKNSCKKQELKRKIS